MKLTLRPCSVQCTQRSSVSQQEKRRNSFFIAPLSALIVLQSVGPAMATGLEAIENPFSMPEAPALIKDLREAQTVKLKAADDAFENSDFLKELKQRSADNAKARKAALESKYCMRQAELGIGDCGGLQLIPGATKNGKQQTPQFMKDFFGIKDEDFFTGAEADKYIAEANKRE